MAEPACGFLVNEVVHQASLFLARRHDSKNQSHGVYVIAKTVLGSLALNTLLSKLIGRVIPATAFMFSAGNIAASVFTTALFPYRNQPNDQLHPKKTRAVMYTSLGGGVAALVGAYYGGPIVSLVAGNVSAWAISPILDALPLGDEPQNE